MARSDASRPGRPSSGRPGRGGADTPTARTASRPTGRATPSKPAPDAPSAQEPDSGSTIVRRLPAGLRMTQRAAILGVVIAVLLFSYATTLRVYFTQQYQIAQTRQQIQAHEQSISDLNDEIQRWQDPEYVKIQARERLGWVVPGEIGFRVIGPDGQPYGGGSQIGTTKLPDGEYATTWWDKMWGSVITADDPTPVDEPAETEPIKPDAQPPEGP